MCAARVLLCVCHLLIMFRKYVDCNKGIYMCKGASIICVRVGMEIFNETTFLTTQLGGGTGIIFGLWSAGTKKKTENCKRDFIALHMTKNPQIPCGGGLVEFSRSWRGDQGSL